MWNVKAGQAAEMMQPGTKKIGMANQIPFLEYELRNTDKKRFSAVGAEVKSKYRHIVGLRLMANK